MVNPGNPVGPSPDDDWAAYEPTQAGTPTPDFTKYPPPQAQIPQAPIPQYGAQYPYPGQQLGTPPQTGQTSSIVALVFGALLTLSCYGTIIGIAPLVLSIIGFTKANSVTSLWAAGRSAEAVEAAESSKKLAMWAWISMGIGLVLAAIAIVVFIVWAVNVDPSPGPSRSPYTTEFDT